MAAFTVQSNKKRENEMKEEEYAEQPGRSLASKTAGIYHMPNIILITRQCNRNFGCFHSIETIH